MNTKKILNCITVSLLLLLVVYNITFLRIGGRMVYRYTEEFRIGADCNEKELKKIGKLKMLSKLNISSKNVRSLDFVYDLSSRKELDIGYAPDLDMSYLSECSELETLFIFEKNLTVLSI